MRIWSARVFVLLLVVLASTMGSVVQPAWACGCGAMVSNDPLQVDGEASIVNWDGNVEQILMKLAVNSQATDAAWIFPTPTVATVQLGFRDWFLELDALTRPTELIARDWWPRWKGPPAIFGARSGDGVGGAPVNVLNEQRLGPFDVATLEASDAGALSSWLTANGYQLSPELAQTLDVYVKKRWKYVAVKLAPQAETQPVLNGELVPLRLSFSSDRLV